MVRGGNDRAGLRELLEQELPEQGLLDAIEVGAAVEPVGRDFDEEDFEDCQRARNLQIRRMCPDSRMDGWKESGRQKVLGLC